MLWGVRSGRGGNPLNCLSPLCGGPVCATPSCCQGLLCSVWPPEGTTPSPTVPTTLFPPRPPPTDYRGGEPPTWRGATGPSLKRSSAPPRPGAGPWLAPEAPHAGLVPGQGGLELDVGRSREGCVRVLPGGAPRGCTRGWDWLEASQGIQAGTRSQAFCPSVHPCPPCPSTMLLPPEGLRGRAEQGGRCSWCLLTAEAPSPITALRDSSVV